MANTTARLQPLLQAYLDLDNINEEFGLISPGMDKVAGNGRNIMKGTGSNQYTWGRRARRTRGGIVVIGQELDFNMSQPYQEFTLDYKNWVHTDAVSELEEEQAHGKNAYRATKNIVKGLVNDMFKAMAAQLWVAGDADNLDGLQTPLSYSDSLGGTAFLLTGNNDSIYGANTAPGSVAGTTSNDDGYRLTTPGIFDGTSSEGTGTDLAANAAEVMRKATHLAIQRGASVSDLAWFFNRSDYGIVLNSLGASDQLQYMVNGPAVNKHNLGMTSVSFDGVPIFLDGYIPDSVNLGFLLSFNDKTGIGLISPAEGKTFKAREGDYIDGLGTKYALRFHGNFIIQALDHLNVVITAA